VEPVREVAQAIVNLGFADELRLAPFIKALRDRPISESTQQDESEADMLLDALERSGVIDALQRDAVERVVRGEKTPRAHPPESTASPYAGKVFGSFKAIEKIGEGGMGTVYRAERQDDLSRDYVIKVLSPLAADTATYVRFQREGAIMAALRHPNVVRVFASGEQDGLSYIVMEFVDGPTLQDIFEKRKRFDWQNAAKAGRQIALALDAAHSIGVIHRDVKPQNILLSRTEGLLKVGDFGLAKIHRAPSDPMVSRAGDVLGSPAYIAPEQWGDHDVDPRADLWALGVVLYQLVTGVLPFRGRSPSDYARRILNAPYDPVSLYAPDCPEGVAQLIARLLEKHRENRYATAGQVTADLERVLRGELPDLPRLVLSQGAPPERWFLLGRDSFLLGRDPRAQVVLSHSSIAERHAAIERTSAGMLLREIDGKGLVRVNGLSVREIALKDDDAIELGDAPMLRYRSGNALPAGVSASAAPSPVSGLLAPARGSATSFAPPLAVPGPLFDGLLREQHARAVLALIELLDETTLHRRVERARRRLLAAGVDAEVTGRAVDRGLAALRRTAVGIPDRLFTATHENLGSDPTTWLAWWLTSGRERFPAQALPPGPRGQGALVVLSGEAGASPIVPLAGLEQWSLGRGSECSVRVVERSVSRKHATIHRLLTRYAIRDEGSRFGTMVWGERRPVALLRHDDSIELGRAKLVFRHVDPVERAGSQEDGRVGIDAFVFDALVEMRSPCTSGALVAFLDLSPLPGGGERERALGLGEEEAGRVVRAVREERRRAALEALPAIAKKNHGSDLAAWKSWWAEAREKAPPQVAPEGWTLP
jgi:serine/threonine protein kinase